jgi:hypothetical protein
VLLDHISERGHVEISQILPGAESTAGAGNDQATGRLRGLHFTKRIT